MTDLTQNTELIEYVVTEVVRRLRQNDVRQDEPLGQDSTVELTERLITLANLPARSEEVKRIIVMQDAVVTPSVLDELRDRGIHFERDGRRGSV